MLGMQRISVARVSPATGPVLLAIGYGWERREMAMRLEIYVASHCTGCQEALHIAELAQGIAGLDVAVIHLDHVTPVHPPVPTRIVAVPTYLLDGRVVSLGNPYRDEFLAHLRSYAH